MHLKRIVIDTCVVVSALRSRRGASYQIIADIGSVRFRHGVSVPLYLEYESQCLALHQSRETPLRKTDIRAVLRALVYHGTHVPIYFSVRPNLRDESDDMVYECAVNWNADYLVTHNVKDFRGGDLQPYSLDVITPRDFLAQIGS